MDIIVSYKGLWAQATASDNARAVNHVGRIM